MEQSKSIKKALLLRKALLIAFYDMKGYDKQDVVWVALKIARMYSSLRSLDIMHPRIKAFSTSVYNSLIPKIS